jgi:adenylate cyclase
MLANAPDFREDAGMADEFAPLLDGLEGRERRAREQLLTMLSGRGFTLRELEDAVAENRLALLPVAQVLGGSYTAAEVEERSGTPAALVKRIRRLGGLPQAQDDDRVFSDADVEMARSIRLYIDAGIDDESLVEITRVMGEAMARLAATVTGAFVASFLEPGDSEDAVALRFAALAEQLMPSFGPVLVAAFSQHLRESVGRGMLGQAQLETGRIADAQDVAIGFADLVGFTRLGGEIEVRELGHVAGRLAELAFEATVPPVRLVKTIGDAAMFVSTDPAPLIDVALTLLEAAERAELPSLRVGLAWGQAVQRTGDFYGNAVNLASRVTGAARPGSVLCTEEMRDAAPDQFEFSSAGAFRLKGVPGHVPLYRARRLAPGAGDEPEAGPSRARTRKSRADRSRR